MQAGPGSSDPLGSALANLTAPLNVSLPLPAGRVAIGTDPVDATGPGQVGVAAAQAGLVGLALAQWSGLVDVVRMRLSGAHAFNARHAEFAAARLRHARLTLLARDQALVLALQRELTMHAGEGVRDAARGVHARVRKVRSLVEALAASGKVRIEGRGRHASLYWVT